MASTNGNGLFGDWNRLSMALKRLSTKLTFTASAILFEDGELLLGRMREHIDAQDLGWTPLKDSTVKLKHGSETIYVESGWLKDNLSVTRLKSSEKESTIFVGASPWQTHPSGVRFSDLMMWLEYGTSKMPARPLIRPTFEQMKNELRRDLVSKFKDAILSNIRG